MPTIPLKQMAFLSQSLAHRMTKRDGPCRYVCQKNEIPLHAGKSPDAEFPWYKTLILIADWLETHGTVTPLPRQPHDGQADLIRSTPISLTSRQPLFTWGY